MQNKNNSEASVKLARKLRKTVLPMVRRPWGGSGGGGGGRGVEGIITKMKNKNNKN